MNGTHPLYLVRDCTENIEEFFSTTQYDVCSEEYDLPSEDWIQYSQYTNRFMKAALHIEVLTATFVMTANILIF